MTATQKEIQPVQKALERVLVALDVETTGEAREIVGELAGHVGGFKIGLQLFTAAGPAFVEEIASAGHRVFLDLKFHDIPNTVATAGVEAARLGVWMFNVHGSGGREMMCRTVSEVADFCQGIGRDRPQITAVTVLTSIGVEGLRETGVGAAPSEQVSRLASLANAAGLDGVVASANEAALIRTTVSRPGFLIVTPGIRPANATNDDQKRVTTPGTAIIQGADYLVIGRPIVSSSDRRSAAAAIVDEVKAAIGQK